MTIVHIEPMSPTSQPSIQFPAAILSAVIGNDAGDPLINVAGQPVLAHQIAALRSAGISKFLVEVDSVPGSLLAMADRLMQSGCAVDFVRSINDVRDKICSSELVIIQAEGVYVEPDLLLDLLRQGGAFTVTVDGRDENEAFERMDLNTRWAGLAVVSVQTVTSIGELPDGWSMTSSLLRQAMQDGVAQRALKQSELQTGRLRRILSVADAEYLATELMAKRAGKEPGLIEAQLLTPFAAKIASSMWHNRSRNVYSDAITLFLGALSLGLAGAGWTFAAAGSAMVGILGNSVRLALGNHEAAGGLSRWVEPVMWVLLGTALILSASRDAYQISDGVFAGGVVVGLAVLARHLRLPEWARKSVQSPALIALLMLLIAPIAGAATAAKSLAGLQLFLLIVAKWNHKTQP